MSVLDLGGTSRFWRSATIRPAKVTTVNLGADDPSEPWLRHVVGDACNPDIVLGKQRFDLVFSNSVIEHVGGFHQRQQMARVVEERADAYWIQTPYRYFPIEPHFLAPGFQFLPLKLRVAAVLVWPIKRGTAVDRAGAMRKALSIELLSETEFRHLFPSAQIRREKVAGLTKSLIAVRTGRDD